MQQLMKARRRGPPTTKWSYREAFRRAQKHLCPTAKRSQMRETLLRTVVLSALNLWGSQVSNVPLCFCQISIISIPQYFGPFCDPTSPRNGPFRGCTTSLSAVGRTMRDRYTSNKGRLVVSISNKSNTATHRLFL